MKTYITILILALFTQTISALNIDNYEKKITNVNGFIENKGQIIDMRGNEVPSVLFKIKTNNLDCYITKSGITYLFKKYEGEGDDIVCDWERVNLTLKNSSIKKENIIKEFENNKGHLNYYLAHCPNGIRGVKEYGKIIIKNVYPNIDWVLYNTSNKGFKYDFILNKGAKPEDIELIYDAKKQVEIKNKGDLIISTKFGKLIEKSPISYYDNLKIDSHFFIKKIETNSHKGINTHIGFKFEDQIPKIIQDKKLVIDPILEWSTFYTGNYMDRLNSIETDYENNIIFSGFTLSLDFPVLDGGGYYQPSTTTLNSAQFNLNWDCFIVKLDSQGNRLWATCIGSTSRDMIRDMAIDNIGNIFLVGETQSNDFPTVYQSGSYYTSGINGYFTDGILLKFSPSGSLLWSTMFGGESGHDKMLSVSINPINNHLVIVGTTDSGADFPIVNVPNALNHTSGGSFITEFDNNGALVWSTKFALGVPSGVTFDNTGNIFLVGKSVEHDIYIGPNSSLQDNGTYFQNTIVDAPNNVINIDMFIMKVNINRQVEWSTYFGGSGEDIARTVKVDGEDNVYIHGSTDSDDIPLFDAGGLFINNATGRHTLLLKFSNSGDLLWGSHYDAPVAHLHYNNYRWRIPNSIVIDKCNNDVYFKFETTIFDNSQLEQISQLSYQNSYEGGASDAVLLKINKNTELLYTTCFGGDGRDFGGGITLDRDGNLIAAVNNQFINNEGSYPLVQGSGYYQDDINEIYNPGNNKEAIFIAKFNRETLNTDLPEVENELIFCDSVMHQNNWYFNNQEFSQLIQNQYGCDSVIAVLKLIKECEQPYLESNLYIPNVCSPNGDNVNDSFSITFNGELITEDGILNIYNRWGNKVFESKNKMKWKAEKEPTGLYYYIFKYNEATYTGNISLFK